MTTDIDPEYGWLKRDMLEGSFPRFKKPIRRRERLSLTRAAGSVSGTVGIFFLIAGVIWLVSILGFPITFPTILAIGLVAIGGFFIASPLTSKRNQMEA